MEKPTISSFTTQDFVNWQESGSLSLTPKFQRREVWKTPARYYFGAIVDDRQALMNLSCEQELVAHPRNAGVRIQVFPGNAT